MSQIMGNPNKVNDNLDMAKPSHSLLSLEL